MIVAGAGPQTALFADAASFALVAVLLATASGLPRARPESAGWITRLRRALAYVGERPQLRLLIGAQAAAFVFFTIVIPIEVVFAKQTLGAGDGGMGLCSRAGARAWSPGASPSPSCDASRCASCSRSRPSRSGSPICSPGRRRASRSPVLRRCSAEWETASSGSALMTAAQQLTRAEYQARVVSLVESTAKAAPGLGFVIGGATAALFNPRVSYAVAGLGVIAVLAVASVALARAGWRGEPAEEIDLEESLREATAVPQISDNISVGTLEAPKTASR